MTDAEKREKVIKKLERELAKPDFVGTALLRDAIALLKAQEPVEPLRINHDTKWQRDTECICCECGGSFYRLKVNFCPWCGKEVKWND